MDFMIFDSDGNALAALEDRSAAYATLRDLAMQEPERADSLALLEYDIDGGVAGRPLTISDLPPVWTVEGFAVSFVVSAEATGVTAKTALTVPRSVEAMWAPLVTPERPVAA